jgi:SAM-dependent methyltransferase
MADSPVKRRNPVRSILGKGRRGLRRALLGKAPATADPRVEELWNWVNGIQQVLNSTSERVDDVFRRWDREALDYGDHTDAVVDQLWRRLEAADARLATQLEQLQTSTGRQLADLGNLGARLRTENAAILRLIGHEDKIIAGEPERPANSLPIAHMTLFSEVERGSSEVLLQKLKQYVDYFADSDGPVIDIGCGKGDFLQLMKDVDKQAYGVDLDDDAVKTANDRGLDARLEDLFGHLKSLADDSLGGAFSSQVVEHLPADTIAPLYEELYRVVKPGGRVIIETPNPATFATHVQSFWRDPTHIRPVPQPALDFAARSAGFVNEQTVFTSPSPDSERLARIEIEPKDPLMAEFVRRFNANAERLDDLLFGYQDFALVVRKP